MAEHATREQTGPAKTGCRLRLPWPGRLRQAVREIAQATPLVGCTFPLWSVESGGAGTAPHTPSSSNAAAACLPEKR